MNYASGLMMGAAIGGKIHKCFCGKQNNFKTEKNIKINTKTPIFCKVFEIKGRRRYRSSLIIDNQNLAKLIQDKVRRMRYVSKVRVDYRTGSILICCLPQNEKYMICVERYLRRILFTSSALPGNVSRDRFSSGTMKVYEMFNYFNNCIREKTNNLLDFNILLSLLFIVRGVRKILIYNQRVSGPQLIWWAFSLLRGWRMV